MSLQRCEQVTSRVQGRSVELIATIVLWRVQQCNLFQVLLVLALIAVAAAQYPYYAGYYGTGYYGTYASPYAYSGLGYGFYGR